MNHIPALALAVPLTVAALLGAGNKHVPRWLADSLALLTAVAETCGCAYLTLASEHNPIVYWFGNWTPRHGIALGISFTVDPLGAGMATLTSLLVLAALIFSLRYFDSVGTIFHSLMMVFLGAMCAFTLTGDLFNMFVWFELMGAAAYALCGYKSAEPGPIQGAMNFAVTNTAGAFLVLSGIGLLYGQTGALNLAQIGRTLNSGISGLIVVSFILITAGCYVKGAVVPFHFWLADAHAVAPTPVCILFSGVMVELGIYAVARVYWTVFAGPFGARPDVLQGVFIGLGGLTAITGALMCFLQRHIKRLLAFSTISHVGILVIGFGLMQPRATAGAAIYVLGHGTVKAALFLCAGILLHRLGSVDEFELQGHGRKIAWVGAIWVFAGLGLAGLLPFGTFFGDAWIEESARRLHFSWISIVLSIAEILTASAVFRVAGRVFGGWGASERETPLEAAVIPEGMETRGPHFHVPLTMWAPAAVLALLGLAIGLIVPIRDVADQTAAHVQKPWVYAARVLDNAPEQREAIEPHESMWDSEVRSLITTALALGVAALALRRRRRPELGGRPQGIEIWIGWLRQLHSGQPGDYVAWLTFGAAGIGGVFLLLLRYR